MLETDKMILVADDELMIREAVSSYLMKQGCNVITAEDGRQALEIFRRRNIVLVVLDLMLPGISGEGYARRYGEVQECLLSCLRPRRKRKIY